MSRYGRISISGNADMFDREPKLMSEQRFSFKQKPPEPEPQYGKICPGCNTRRTPREFAGVGETFKHCSTCRGRGLSRETQK